MMKRRKQLLDINPKTAIVQNNYNSEMKVGEPLQLHEPVPENNVSLNYEAGISVFPSSLTWQLCYAEDTGYPYYWNTQTNEVKWTVPEELAQPLNTDNEIPPIQPDSPNADKYSHEHNNKTTNLGLVCSYELSSDDENSEALIGRQEKRHRSILKKDNHQRILNETNESTIKSQSSSSYSLSFNETTNGNWSNTLRPEIAPYSTTKIITEPSFDYSVVDVATTAGSLVPYYDEDDASSNKHFVEKPNQIKPFSALNIDYQSSGDEEDDENEETEMLLRLREKALFLIKLGGDVPDDLKNLVDETKTVEDVIAEIEKELPPDYYEVSDSVVNEQAGVATTSINSSIKNDIAVLEDKAEKCLVTEPTKNQTEGNNSAVSNGVKQTKSTKLKKIKLSARAKELIHASMLTAKARQTDFVETDDGLKPADKAEKFIDEQTKLASLVPEIGTEKKLRKSKKTEQLNLEIETGCVSKKDALNFQDIANKEKSTNKKSLLTVTKEILNQKAKMSGNKFSSIWAIDSNQVLGAPPEMMSERRGFGYSCELDAQNSGVMSTGIQFVKAEIIDMTSQQIVEQGMSNSTSITTMCSDSNLGESDMEIDHDTDTESTEIHVDRIDNISTKIKLVSEDYEDTDESHSVSTTIEDSQAKNITDTHIKNNIGHFDIDNFVSDIIPKAHEEEISDDENLIEVSRLVIEKLKYLSVGKSCVQPMQIMAIQIETLMGAWQANSLTSEYLSNWLEASASHLKMLEGEAAPKGWLCEWDRSFRRYYYRNLETGCIQWEYPDEDEAPDENKVKIRSPARLGTPPPAPPPPIISNSALIPPPPPIISKRKSESITLSTTVKRHKIAGVPEIFLTMNPPLPPSPPPVIPPPPPPSTPAWLPLSTVPPPPPAPISDTNLIANRQAHIVSCSFLYNAEPSENIDINAEIPRLNNEDSIVSAKDAPSQNLGSVLDSFYSDIASLESDKQVSEPTAESSNNLSSSQTQQLLPPSSETNLEPVETTSKMIKTKKKKIKFESGLGLKKKGLEGLVAKWQKASSTLE